MDDDDQVSPTASEKRNRKYLLTFKSQISIYAGASFDQAIGDELSTHTRLTPLIGSTEGGLRFYTIALDKKLWNTFDYTQGAPHRWVKREGYYSDPASSSSSSSPEEQEEPLYELVFDRPADGKPSFFNGTFWNLRWYRDADSVATRELYAPVADLDGATRWVFRARADDLTKLSFLAKFNATHIEARVLRSPAVRRVLVGGEGRPAPYVLIEPREGALEAAAAGGGSAETLLDDIYEEAVAVANDEDIGEIRIPRETVFLAKEDKPLRINLKALVLRREVERDYKEEIDELYRNYEEIIGSGRGT